MKYCIGPMSVNIVDAIIEFATPNQRIGLIPSRRQVDSDGGYVNNWKTEDFSDYVRRHTRNVFLQRDHGGPGQGQQADNGITSLEVDTQYFDAIHIDPWKKFPDYHEGLQKTVDLIQKAHMHNPDILFEVGTEEAIRRFEVEELDRFLGDLASRLPASIYKNIQYAVVQSGVGLDLGKMRNTGTYDAARLQKMVKICRKHNLLSKEHNGDYLTPTQIKKRFDIGLDCINIAPEFGQLETLCYLEEINDEKILQTWYDICYNSARWKKWVDPSFIPQDNKRELITICGHYVFSDPRFLEIKPAIDDKIRKTITNRLYELHQI